MWGTVTRLDGKAYAVIEDTKTREQNLYRTGDAIQNATVKMILREKVVLTVGEGDEILTMEDVAKGGEAHPSSSSGSGLSVMSLNDTKAGMTGLDKEKINQVRARWKRVFFHFKL